MGIKYIFYKVLKVKTYRNTHRQVLTRAGQRLQTPPNTVIVAEPYFL